MNNEVAKTEQDNLPVLPEIEKNLIKNETKYTTAMVVAKPRDLAHCLKNIEIIVKRNPEAMFYSWDVKTKDGKIKAIEGGTVGAANAILGMLGNNVAECDIVFEDENQWILKAYYIDLETGSTNSRLFRQRKNQVEGRYDEDRKLDIAFQIGQSKAKRNVIAESNKWLFDYIIEMAKKAAREEIDGNFENTRNMALQFFHEQGVTRAKLESKIGKKIEDMDGGDVVILRGYARAIQEGEMKLEDIFAEPKKETITVDASGLFNEATATKE